MVNVDGKKVEMKDCFTAVSEDCMKANAVIIANMQAIVDLLPNLNVEGLVQSMLLKKNEMHMVMPCITWF